MPSLIRMVMNLHLVFISNFCDSDVLCNPEFTKIAVATGAGFLVMGFIGFFVKLM